MGRGTQHIPRTITDALTGETSIMQEAQFTGGKSRTWEDWFTCYICGLEYPRSKVILRGEQAFCLPLEDYKEMIEYSDGKRGF